MVTTKIVYATDYEDGNHGALYINGRLAITMEDYEFTPVEVIKVLLNHNLLHDIEANEVQAEFEGYIDFPDNINDLKIAEEELEY